MNIQRLSPELIGKIAAGEVVERPAAAIKELVENSLDAGATAITVEVRKEATEYLRVTDNGCGIDSSDLRMAFERHATSKIRADRDLDAIATLGFRGEALASIAAVSRVTLNTRTDADEAGFCVVNEGGQIVSLQETACPRGTSIIVRDLFYNTPVRRQFLKKGSAELQAITDLVTHLILSRPDVSFRLIIAGKTVYHSPGDGDLSSAIYAVFGGNARKQMRPVSGTAQGIVLEGFVGIGELARGNRNGEFFFINRRTMKSLPLSAALENACRERVMIGKYPMCVLNLTVPYESVNVNIHPNKLEVRFRNEGAVCEAVEEIIREALQDRDALEKPVEMNLTAQTPDAPPPLITPEIRQMLREKTHEVIPGSRVPDLPAVPPVPPPVPVFQERRETLPPPEQTTILPPLPEKAEQTEKIPPVSGETAPVSVRSGIPETEQAEQVNSILASQPRPMKIFGAVFDTFILIEYADHLLLIDQHAVHERLLFDRMMRSFGSGGMGQELLIPLTMSVTRGEMALLEENRELLEGIGLRTEPFGETDVAIRSLPVILGDTQPMDFVREILADLESGRYPGFEKKRTALLQSACKHAIKGGEPLSEDLMRDLVEQMIDGKVTPTCPHGRPLVVAISHTELDKKFRRIQT